MKRKWDSRRNKTRNARSDHGTSTKSKGIVKKMTAAKSRVRERDFVTKVMRGVVSEAPPTEYYSLVDNRG